MSLRLTEVLDRMPETLLHNIRELIRVDSSNATNTIILLVYERHLRALLLRMDCHIAVEEIAAVAGQSTYSTDPLTTRIMEVLYGTADNEVNLLKTTSAARDNLVAHWRTEADGTPEVWWNDEVDPTIDDVSRVEAEHFMVRPAPAAAGTLRLYRTSLPADGVLDAPWLFPILRYETVGQALIEMGWEQEAEERAEINRAASAFFAGLGAVWEQIIRERTTL